MKRSEPPRPSARLDLKEERSHLTSDLTSVTAPLSIIEEHTGLIIKYRPEIDGLRAIAVTSVIAYHAGFNVLSGGFLGVDVFFVISGFLITSLIINDISEGKFSFRNFYERRVRRIFPALFVVLIACIPPAIWLLLPYQLMEFSWSSISAVTFLSNAFFWRQGGYFAEASEFRPLIHTWSLAVEEQFYIFFPIMAIIIAKLRFRHQSAILVVTIFASIAVSEWAWRNSPGAGFFLLPSRIWELMIGSLVAYATSRRPKLAPRYANEIISALALIALLLSLTFLEAAYSVPSVWTLIPVISTAIILYAANAGTIVATILSNRAFVGIGVISYSMYLWHQPIFAFSRAIEPRPSMTLLSVLLLSILALSYLSWRFVEQPFRNRSVVSVSRVYLFSSMLAGTLIVSNLSLAFSNGLISQVPIHHREWASTGIQIRRDYIITDFSRSRAQDLDESEYDILIVGDSFSQDLFNILKEHEDIDISRVATIHINPSCQFTFGLSGDDSPLRGSIPSICSRQGVTDDVAQRIREASIVLIAMRWDYWAAQQINRTLENIGINDDTSVVIFGTKRFARPSHRWINLTVEEAEQLRAPSLQAIRDINLVLSQEIRRLGLVQFIDLTEFYCSQNTEDPDRSCRVFADDGSPISYDALHLTQSGARFFSGPVVQRLAELGVLPRP